jgi:mono/diheme cytochrome c family protein
VVALRARMRSNEGLLALSWQANAAHAVSSHMNRIHPSLILLLAAGACSGNAPSMTAQTAAPLDYYRDTKPIFDARCVTCHQSGGIGPFPMTTFKEVEPYAALIKNAVSQRIMPPWPADRSCAEYEHDLSLTDEEISKIATWVDQGTAAGDPASASPAIPASSTSLSRVDLTLSTESYTTNPPAGKTDDFRCFVLDWPATTTKYIVGFEIRPSNRTIAHHLVSAYVPASFAALAMAADEQDPGPGFACSSEDRPAGSRGGGGDLLGGLAAGKQPAGSGILAVWAPGLPAVQVPPGTGLKIEPGSKILLQMHYNTINGNGTDQTSIDVMLADTVEKEAFGSFFTDPSWPKGSMTIPAGDPDAMHWFAGDASTLNGGNPFMISSVLLHAHVRAKSANLSLIKADGTTECLLNIPKWNFAHQLFYPLAMHRKIEPGDQLRIECHWDNSAANQPVVNGVQVQPTDINWGEGSTAEMCLAGYLGYPM